MQVNRGLNSTKQANKSNDRKITNEISTIVDSISRADDSNTYKLNVKNSPFTRNLTKNETNKIRAHFLMSSTSCRRNSFVDTNSFKIRPYYLTLDHVTSKGSGKSISSRKITKSLAFITFFYGLFSFSYFLCFALYYFESKSNLKDQVHINYIKGTVEISEIFMMANYSMIFILYCATGTIFRSQLKYSRKFTTFLE
jgi:hypothetical protein